MERNSKNRSGSGARPGGGGKRSKRAAQNRVKKSSGRGLLRGGLILLLLLFVCVAVVLVTGGGEGDLLGALLPAPRFDENVFVAGIDVGGLTAEQAQPRVQAAADAAVAAGEYRLVYDDKALVLPASKLGIVADVEGALREALDYSKKQRGETERFDAALSYSLDEQKLTNELAQVAEQVDAQPVEPAAVPNKDIEADEFFIYTEGKDGAALDTAAAAGAVQSLVQKGGLGGDVQLKVLAVPPDRSLEDVRSKTALIARYTTRFRSSSSDQIIKNRVFNIKKAAGIINGCEVAPDEEWSFNGFVGLRTPESGWKEANGISGGKEYTLQAGGGICQVSTTLYNALLCGNVKVTDRRKHSIPSDYVDKGLDATVDSSGIDLKFINDTDEPLYVFVRIAKDEESSRFLNITISLYGKPLPDGVTYKTRSVEVEVIPREEIQYTSDPTTPLGFQRVIIIRRDGFAAEAYLDRYQDGKLADSRLMYTDRYQGNIARVGVGTGDPERTPIPQGATAIGNTVVDAQGNIFYVDMPAVNALLAKVE